MGEATPGCFIEVVEFRQQLSGGFGTSHTPRGSRESTIKAASWISLAPTASMRPTCLLSSLLALSASVAALAPPVSDTVGQGTAHVGEPIHHANRLLGPTASVFIGPLNGSPSQCGTTILETDLSVLISPDVFEGGARCGDDVTVTRMCLLFP